VRARKPQSLLAGIMWSGSTQSRQLRHTCEQGDQLKKYGWSEHNGNDYGRQLIIDGCDIFIFSLSNREEYTFKI
jgi:mannosyl-oligosaccharide glucosidase